MRFRATQGRVRKSIFDVLSGLIEDRVAMDIFAGTGSIGLEALKRGAKEVVFIEKDKRLSSIIRETCTSQTLGEGNVLTMDAFRALPILKKKGFLFDIFFADPPYNYRYTVRFLDCFFSSGILAKDAKGVVEHSKHLSLPDCCASLEGRAFKKWKEKRFGETMLTFYQQGERN